MSVTQLPFIDLQAQRRRLGKNIDDAIARVLEHGRYIMGPEVGELEQQLVAFSGAKHAVACSSGTDALLLALMAWEIGPGDAVFVPAFTFPATAEVVALIGATPVFVDVFADTYNIDPESLRAAVGMAAEKGLNAKVVVAVDLFGLPADYTALRDICDETKMKLLADGAQSFGATYNGRKVGVLADVTTTSFFPAKPLGCYGDGGAVLTDDDELAMLFRSLLAHGKGGGKYDIARVGLNARMDTIQAAIVIQKLTIFAGELEARQRIAESFNAKLGALVQVPVMPNHCSSAWAQYTIQVDNRDALIASLSSEGIPTAVYYPGLLNEQAPYAGCPVTPSGLAVAEELKHRVVSLPMHPYLKDEDIERICSAVESCCAD